MGDLAVFPCDVGAAPRLWAVVAAAVIVAASLAGCAGSDGTSDSLTGPGPELEAEGAVLRGLVVSTEVAPIAGAVVAIEGREPTATGEDGRFEFRGLEPGTYRLFAQALGFTSVARSVDVGADAIVELTLILEALPIEEPYLQVLHFRGYAICEYMIVVITGRLPPQCDGGQAKNLFRVEVLGSWRFHVTEMSWTGNIGSYDYFRLFTADDGDCTSGSPCYGLVYGRQYARLEGEPGETELVLYYDPWADHRGPPYPDGNFTMVVNGQWIGLFVDVINGLPGNPCQVVLQAAAGTTYKRGCVGVGVSTGIPYDLYVSLFHWQGPEDRGACCPATKYTALPDK